MNLNARHNRIYAQTDIIYTYIVELSNLILFKSVKLIKVVFLDDTKPLIISTTEVILVLFVLYFKTVNLWLKLKYCLKQEPTKEQGTARNIIAYFNEPSS